MELSERQTVYWTLAAHGQWQTIIAATSKGLCYAGPRGKPVQELESWVKKRLPGSLMAEDAAIMRPYAEQFEQYFQGRRTDFKLPLDLYGTPFQLSVWQALSEIPFGQTLAYSELAEQIGKPGSVRAVGAAIGANPVLVAVPCHRVIGKNRLLTGYRGGLEMKADLLALEQEDSFSDGVRTNASGCR